MRLLNIFNGDCAYLEWRRGGLPGECLVWRENYLHGSIPHSCDSEQFNHCRAAELHRIAPDKTELSILNELNHMHHVLTSLQFDDNLVLWFDLCPFDRTMLSAILFLLHSSPSPPHVSLICRDVVWNADNFLRHRHDGVLLAAADLQYGAAQWLAFTHGAAAEFLLDKLIGQNEKKQTLN